MLKRFIRMIYECETTQKFIVVFNIVYYTVNAVRPFFIFILSKIIIQGVMSKENIDLLLKNVFVILGIYCIFSIVGGFCEKKKKFDYQKFRVNHDQKKAIHLLSLDYELTEQNKMQATISQLEQFLRAIVFSPQDFLDKLGMMIGGIIGIGVSVYFAVDLFDNAGIGNIPGYVINILFIFLFLLFNISTFFSLKKIYAKFGKHISQGLSKHMRYLKTYIELIYNYKTGKDIRLYDKELATAYNIKYQNIQKESHDFMAVFWGRAGAFIELTDIILATLVYIFIIIKAVNGTIAISEIFMYIGVVNMFSLNTKTMMDGVGVVTASDKFRKKLFEFFDTKPMDKKENTKPIPKTTEPVFEFKNVSFKYPDSETFVLKNINLKLDGRKKLALVGENGSGKTTLIKLLVGLYAPTEGEILLNGVNIQDYNIDEYMKMFSVVFQDFKLLAFNLGENVATSTNYDKNKVIQAMQKVQMEKFYNRHGCEANLYKDIENNGIEISGGEAQKIAMARAIYHNGSVYILDEPTAALDPVAEAEIYEHFNNITSNNSSIYISHRLSSCKFCDTIAVLDNGKLVQEGTHENLVTEKNGKYAELWTAQAKHYI